MCGHRPGVIETTTMMAAGSWVAVEVLAAALADSEAAEVQVLVVGLAAGRLVVDFPVAVVHPVRGSNQSG